MGAAAASSTNSFVGRERELAELRAALDDANAGRGRLFVLSGEPGIGKTRLAEELAREAAARGMRAVWGRSWEGGGAPAYWPLVQILRSLVVDPNRSRTRSPVVAPEVGQLIPELASEVPGQAQSDPQQARFRLFDAVTTTLREAARSQPLVLILDDLHEADQSSLEMLKFIARTLPESHLLIVGTCRDAEVRRSPMLSEAIAEIVRGGGQMPLGGLALGEVGRMAAARSEQAPSTGFISDLHRVTAGNPLYVEGVLRVLMAEGKLDTSERLDLSGFRLPEGVRGAIHKRLAILSASARELLTVAAAIGQEFDGAVLQRVSQVSADEIRRLLREAVEIGVLVTDCEPPRFSHPLIREALHGSAGELESARMHSRIGEVIEEIHAADLAPHSAELAYHYELGGNLEKAIKYAKRAAKAAGRVYAYQQGLHFSETALRLMEKRGAPADDRARQLLHLATFAQAFDFRAAIDQLEKAITLFDDAGDVEGSAEAHVRAGGLLGFDSVPNFSPVTLNIDRAFFHYAAAEKMLRDRPPSATMVGLYCGIAKANWENVRLKESVAAAQRAMEIAEQLGNEEAWIGAVGTLAFALTSSGQVADAFALIERLKERTQDSGDPAIVELVAHTAGCHFFYGGDLASAGQCFERLVSTPTVSETARLGYYRFLVAPLAFTGKLKKSRAIATRYFRDYGCWQNALCEGKWEKILEPTFGRSDRQNPWGSLWEDVIEPLCVQGYQLRIAARLERGEQLLRRATEVCGGLVWCEFCARTDLILIYSELQIRDKAAMEIARCREIVTAAGDGRAFVGDLDRAEGVLAALSGNIAEAESRFAKAVEIYRRYTRPFEEADTLHYWGRALNLTGDATGAREKFDRAIEIYRQVGAGDRWIERIEKAATSTRKDGVKSSSLEPNQFRRDGTHWSIVYQGPALRVKDSRGMRYLAHLLRYPQQEFHALDLANSEQVGEKAIDEDAAREPMTSASEVLDAKAKADYSRRLKDLREEQGDAERCNDLGRAAKAQQEIEELSGLLSASLGLGGRSRQFGSNAERARVAVSKRIKSAIGQLRDLNPELGRHLAAAVATGNFCSYRPDPKHPIDWQF